MASLKSIRKRITSVKNTQKITRAMKMVAAAKLRRAQGAVVSARPYSSGLKNLILSVAARLDSASHPLMTPRENAKKAVFLIFTSNRGLCGGFNSNLLRKLDTWFKTDGARYESIEIKVIGKKGRDYYRTRKREPSDVFVSFADKMEFVDALDISSKAMQSFIDGDVDDYFIVYNQFKSALVQEVQIEKLLPLALETKSEESLSQVDFIYEPDKPEILDYLVPKYVATQVFRAHLESVASELGARMTAMESATKNAKEMIGLLTLQYNRARQAAITTELMDIVNGAESIK